MPTWVLGFRHCLCLPALLLLLLLLLLAGRKVPRGKTVTWAWFEIIDFLAGMFGRSHIYMWCGPLNSKIQMNATHVIYNKVWRIGFGRGLSLSLSLIPFRLIIFVYGWLQLSIQFRVFLGSSWKWQEVRDLMSWLIRKCSTQEVRERWRIVWHFLHGKRKLCTLYL